MTLNKLIHGLVAVGLSIACWFLWGMLRLTAGFMHRVSDYPPMFTQLCVSLKWVFAVLPIVALAYCLVVWVRKPDPHHSWVGFFATTMGVLVLTAMPALIAVWLPMVKFIEQAAGK
jgi:hypothetical protein